MSRKRTTTTPPDPNAPALERVTTATTEYQVTPEGKALLAKHPKGLPYHTPKPARVTNFRPLTARTDDDVAAWVTRLTKAMTTEDDFCQRQIGRPVGVGYRVVVTDGHRALCAPGEPTAPGKPLRHADTAHWFDATDGLQLALHRAKVAGPSSHAVRLTVDPGLERLTLETSNLEDGMTAFEWVPIAGQLAAVTQVVNAAQLLEALGLPGLRVSLSGDQDTPDVIRTADDAYRVVIMPIKTTKTAARESAAVDESAAIAAADALPSTLADSMYAAKATPPAPTGRPSKKRAHEIAIAREEAARARLSYDTDTLFEQGHWATLCAGSVDGLAGLSYVDRQCLHEAWYAHQRRRNWPKLAIYDVLDTKLHVAGDRAAAAEHAAVPLEDAFTLSVTEEAERHSCHFLSDEKGVQSLRPPIAQDGTLWVFSDCNDDRARQERRRYVSALVPLDEWVHRGETVPTDTAQQRYDSFRALDSVTARVEPTDAEAAYAAKRAEWAADALRGDYSLTRVTYHGVEYVVGPRVRLRIIRAQEPAQKAPRQKASKVPKPMTSPAPTHAPHTPGALTPCEACGTPTEPRPFPGRPRYAHTCPHGKPCPAGLRASQRSTGCPTCLGLLAKGAAA